MKFKARVVQINREHPDWTAHAIARELGCSSHYVRELARLLSLNIPMQREGLGNRDKAWVSFAPHEMQRIREGAARSGLAVAGYIRRRVLGAA